MRERTIEGREVESNEEVKYRISRQEEAEIAEEGNVCVRVKNRRGSEETRATLDKIG